MRGHHCRVERFRALLRNDGACVERSHAIPAVATAASRARLTGQPLLLGAFLSALMARGRFVGPEPGRLVRVHIEVVGVSRTGVDRALPARRQLRRRIFAQVADSRERLVERSLFQHRSEERSGGVINMRRAGGIVPAMEAYPKLRTHPNACQTFTMVGRYHFVFGASDEERRHRTLLDPLDRLELINIASCPLSHRATDHAQDCTHSNARHADRALFVPLGNEVGDERADVVLLMPTQRHVISTRKPGPRKIESHERRSEGTHGLEHA
mmetsp:Transcript_61177/g.167710  ORF Transcript_61177/g.167710 Transcript_61177/m.167710 type:complete len:269 (+) Transcript_61177:532-1338(+)